MNNSLSAVIFAFIGSSLINLAQALQKSGLDTPQDQRFKRWGTWLFGTSLMMTGPLVIQYATSLGGASLVGAMSGTGLATLTLFSFLVLKEEIKVNELAGVIIILGASILIGIFSGKQMQSTIHMFQLLLFIGTISLVYITLTLISIKTRKLTGIVLGGFAGATGGFVIVPRLIQGEFGFDQRHITLQRFLQHIFLTIELSRFLAFCEQCSNGRARVEPANPRSGRPHALRQRLDQVVERLAPNAHYNARIRAELPDTQCNGCRQTLRDGIAPFRRRRGQQEHGVDATHFGVDGDRLGTRGRGV